MTSEPPSPSSSTSSFLPTTTLLAIPDGPIASSSKDGRSHLTSLMGGYPTFPPLPASSSASAYINPEQFTCGVCKNTIPLLTQVYCPPEGGENDRNVYVFACPRSACQRKIGRCVLFHSLFRFVRVVWDELKQGEGYWGNLPIRRGLEHRPDHLDAGHSVVLSCTSLCFISSCLYMFLLLPRSVCISSTLRLSFDFKSVRAFRASVRNEVYAADAAEQKAKREKEEAERREKEKINPFSVSIEHGDGVIVS
jgi:hypothetical protein